MEAKIGSGGSTAQGTGTPLGPPTHVDAAASAPAIDPQARPAAVTPATAPRGRSNAAHLALFVLALIAWNGMWIGIAVIAGIAVTDERYLSQQALDEAIGRATIVALLATAGFSFATIGPIASRVGYRVRDVLFLAIPIYSLVFLVKILWRWTGLPDRYWATWLPDAQQGGQPPAVDEVRGTEVLASSEPPLARKRQRPVALLAGVVGLMLVAAAVVYAANQRTGGEDGWRTEELRGLSISVPPSFEVFTDAEDMAASLSEVGIPELQAFAEAIREFPEWFVLFAADPDDQGAFKASVLVLRTPSGGEALDALADEYQAGVEESGYDVIARTLTDVGSGRYPAVRFDAEGRLSWLPRSRDVSYVVDGGAQTWLITFSSVPEEYERFASTFDRSIASLVLS